MPALPSWVSFLGVALLGGVIGGATTRLLPPRATGTSPRSSSGAVTAESPAESEERVLQLERRIGALERRRAAGDALAAYGQALAQGENAGPAPAAARPSDGGTTAREVENPAFELAVRAVLDRIDEERELERESNRSLRQQRRATEIATTLSTELALLPAQKLKVEQLLSEHFAALQKLGDRRAPDQPTTRQERRDRMRQLNEQLETKLSGVLDGKQLSQFRERREELLGFGFGGRRRQAD
jgi:hypothetical protein